MTTGSSRSTGRGTSAVATPEQLYEHRETRELVSLVNEAAELVRTTGEAAFAEFAVEGSRWRRGEDYVFVLDVSGNMLVHPDPELKGRNTLDLQDVNGKPIIRGLIAAATATRGKPEGWYHYEWPVPGGILPRWKSSYVRLVQGGSGNSYVVGSGMYNDRMERAFVVDIVTTAVGEIEKRGDAAFSLLRDPKGPFLVKDTYVFVFDMNGVELVNPAFPNLEGQTLLDMQDSHGKYLIREMLDLVRREGQGWVDHMWPKPGDSVPTQKSSYVSKAMIDDRWVVVGCGAYLADAPRDTSAAGKLSAPELMSLVRDGAALLEKEGERAYDQFRQKGSRWFRDDTYLFVLAMDGTNVFHAVDPRIEGRNDSGLKDILGRPMGQMILGAGKSDSGEGWVHYMYPEPGGVFPAWKSAFVKRVTYPSGTHHIVGSGIYHMQMDKAFIEDLVDRAATLVATRGESAFGQLRDKMGLFVFMDTYVFVDRPNGTEVVNGAQPSLEGKSLAQLRDLNGKAFVEEYIAAATATGAAWVDCYWYKPGQNTPARKRVYVRKAEYGAETFIVGSGLYVE
jgi:signal transduction histidine kinase